tara:strand:- start:1069 stop:2007 length:939 start_codon:yes stop_codon:yes gene_type:complete
MLLCRKINKGYGFMKNELSKLNDPLVGLPMLTPFNDKDEVDYDFAQYNIEKWNKTDADIIIVGTASGEESFLNEAEKLKLLSVVSDSIGEGKVSCAGIDSPSIKETLRLANEYEKAGASLLRIRYPRKESVINEYFNDVLKHSPLPVLLMHQGDPLNFGVAPKPVANPQLLGEIASMDNVFGYVTEHDMRFESTVRNYVPENKKFWICNGSMILLGTLIGCNGTTTAFANIWPNAMKNLLKMGIEGKYNEAKNLQRKVKEIDNLMLPFIASGIKYCLKEMGYKGMVPRKPITKLPKNIQMEISKKLADAKLI